MAKRDIAQAMTNHDAIDQGLAVENPDLSFRATLVPGLDARLVLIDADANIDKFHVLQGLEDPGLPNGPRRYFCFQRWGATGGRGASTLDGPMSLPKVAATIAAAFADKTGEVWGSVEPGHRAKPGMYWLQQLMKPNAEARWEYFVNDGVNEKADGWYPYVPDAMMEVEELYAQHVASNSDPRTASRAIQSGHFCYKVDLEKMQQTNTRTKKVRDIRRVFGPTGSRRSGAAACKVAGSALKAVSRPTKVIKKVSRKPRTSAHAKPMKKSKIVKKPAKKVKKPSIIARGKRAYRHVMSGKKEKTTKGLRKSDLMKNKYGKIVSCKKSALANSNRWIKATVEARKALSITGFCPCGGKSTRGASLLEKARAIYSSTPR